MTRDSDRWLFRRLILASNLPEFFVFLVEVVKTAQNARDSWGKVYIPKIPNLDHYPAEIPSGRDGEAQGTTPSTPARLGERARPQDPQMLDCLESGGVNQLPPVRVAGKR